jgi:membrane-associated phospholipid phosphatase
MSLRTQSRHWLAEADEVDRAAYAAVAGTATPSLDQAMRRLSGAANYSRLSLACAALLAAAGGRRGRAAAASGLASVAATSAVVNLIVKPLGRRRRPNRGTPRVADARRVQMPQSASFPSGHTAAAVAFASGTGRVLPAASFPLYVLAAAVGFSRIHTGVHYPGDVVAGALLGATIADLTGARLGGLERTMARDAERPSD